MNRRPALLAVACLLLLFFRFPPAEAQSLKISGEGVQPLTLMGADLKAMPRSEVSARDRDGKERRYTGVALIEVLRRAGAKVGGDLRGKNLLQYLIARAGDGYEVVFALPELDPEFTATAVLLADGVDGGALPEGTGPFRLIVPAEKKPTRWVRNLTSLEVRLAR